MRSYSHVIKSNQYEAQAIDSNDDIDMEIEEELTMRRIFVGFVKEKLNLRIKEDDVLEIHEMPAKFEGPKAVIVKFNRSITKRIIMKHRRRLHGTNIYINDQLTRKNAEFERMARKLKKDNKIHSS